MLIQLISSIPAFIYFAQLAPHQAEKQLA